MRSQTTAKVVNVHEAKTQLSKLLELVHAGAEVTIAKAGKPYAKLVPLRRTNKRVLGFVDVKVPDEAFAPLTDEELRDWEDGPVFPPNEAPRTALAKTRKSQVKRRERR